MAAESPASVPGRRVTIHTERRTERAGLSQLKQAEYPEQDEYSFWDFATKWARETPNPNWRDFRDTRLEELASAFWRDTLPKGKDGESLLTTQAVGGRSQNRQLAWGVFPKAGPYCPKSIVTAQNAQQNASLWVEGIGPWDALANLGVDDYPNGWFKRIYAPADMYRRWLRSRQKAVPAFLSPSSGLDYPPGLSGTQKKQYDKYVRVVSTAHETQQVSPHLGIKSLTAWLYKNRGNELGVSESMIEKLLRGQYAQATDLGVPGLITYGAHLVARKDFPDA